VVVLIGGVSMPVILRPKDEAFEIVGLAVFSKLMDGKYWSSLADGRKGS